MEGRGQYSPLYPNDKIIPSPLGLGIEPKGEGVVVVGGGHIGVVLRAIGNVCGGRDVNIVVPLYTKL